MAAARLSFPPPLAAGRAKLALFRAAFFTVLGLDAWLQIKNVARYGAGGFNVAHFAWIDAIAPLPTRAAMLVVYLVLAHQALCIACGGAARWRTVLVTALFGHAYFISQLDSYQHHYLVFLLLVLCCFLPRREAAHSLAARLVLVQLAVVYLWAAVAKADPRWLDGSLLEFEVGRGAAARWIAAMPGGFVTASWAVAAIEVALAAALLVPRLNPLALPLGIGLHVGVELSHLSIGLFSYYMFAVYVLLIPDRAIESVAASTRGALARLRPAGPVRWIGLTVSAAGLLLLPFDEAPLVAGVAFAVGAAPVVLRTADDPPSAAGLAPVAASLVLVLLAATTRTPETYFERWGQTADHLGSPAERARAYAGLAAARPERSDAHLYLGDALRDLERFDEALAQYRAAQALDAGDWRPLLGQALVLYRTERPEEALEAVSRARALEPADNAAYLLEQHLRGVLGR